MNNQFSILNEINDLIFKISNLLKNNFINLHLFLNIIYFNFRLENETYTDLNFFNL